MEAVKSAVNAVMGKGKVLLILSSCNAFSNGHPTGWYLPEAAHPYTVFRESGYEVDFASPKGGEAPLDPSSIKDFLGEKAVSDFYNSEEAMNATKNTKAVFDVQHTHYEAVFVVGGHGANLDLPTDVNVVELLGKFWAAGKPVAAVCHGPAALVNVKTPQGEPIVKGRKATTFTNAEEKQVKKDRLKELGATFEHTQPWGCFAVADGQLVTGQNPASADKTARLVVEALQK